MKRILKFSEGIISGDDMRDAIEILPELEPNFRQRKQFDEYYFDSIEVELNLEKLEHLSNMFSVKLNYDEITLEV